MPPAGGLALTCEIVPDSKCVPSPDLEQRCCRLCYVATLSAEHPIRRLLNRLGITVLGTRFDQIVSGKDHEFTSVRPKAIASAISLTNVHTLGLAHNWLAFGQGIGELMSGPDRELLSTEP